VKKRLLKGLTKNNTRLEGCKYSSRTHKSLCALGSENRQAFKVRCVNNKTVLQSVAVLGRS